MKINSVKSVRDEVLKAYEAAKAADHAWQAEMDREGIGDRYTTAARGRTEKLRELYNAKIAADRAYLDLVDTMRRYQDPKQVIV